MEALLICVQRLPFFTFQSVLLGSHDVDQGALQRVQVEAVERPGSFLKGGEKWRTVVTSRSSDDTRVHSATV